MEGRIRAPPRGRICLGKPSLGAVNLRFILFHPNSTAEGRGLAIVPSMSVISSKDSHLISQYKKWKKWE